MPLQHPVLQAQTLDAHLANSTPGACPKAMPKSCLNARIHQKARGRQFPTVGATCNMQRGDNRPSASRVQSQTDDPVALSRVPDATMYQSKRLRRQSHAAAFAKRLCLSSAARAVAAGAAAAAPSSGVTPPAKLAVFVSGGGSNLKALHAATMDSRINGSIVVRLWHSRGIAVCTCPMQTDRLVTWQSGIDNLIINRICGYHVLH